MNGASPPPAEGHPLPPPPGGAPRAALEPALGASRSETPLDGLVLGEPPAPVPVAAQAGRVRLRAASAAAWLEQGAPDPLPHFLVVAGAPAPRRILQAVRALPRTCLLPCFLFDPSGAGPEEDGWDGAVPSVGEDELERVTRIHELMRCFRPVGELVDSRVAQVNLVRFAVSRGLSALRPKLSPDGPMPWRHELPALFGVLAADETLEQWQRAGWTQRRLVDRVQACPRCHGARLNFREACPGCGSLDLTQLPMLHHFRCGNVDRESRFRDGDRLVCPKCARRLYHLGVDYERSAQVSECEDCGHLTQEPKTEAWCYRDAARLELSDLESVPVHEYYPTPVWEEVAVEGVLPRPASGRVFHDRLALYSKPFFDHFAAIEQQRFARYQVPFSVLAVVLKSEDGGALPQGDELRELAALFREQLRDTDVAAHYEEDVFLALLSNTPADRAQVALARLEGCLAAERRPGLSLRAGLAGCREDASASVLVETLVDRLRSATRREGVRAP